MKHSAADVSARLCIEQPNGSRDWEQLSAALRGFDQLRLEQLRFDHAARCGDGTAQRQATPLRQAIMRRRLSLIGGTRIISAFAPEGRGP